MTPKALLFDIFGTVVDWRTGVARELERAFAARGIEEDPVAVAVAWRGEYQPAMEPIRAGDREYVALDDLHLENLGRVLERFELDDRFDAGERAALNSAWEKLPPWPDAVGGLRRLRSRFIVAPCSNGSIALMTRLARYGRLPWDCILGADVARTYKPDPAVYCRSAAAHNNDLAAASEEGMLTAFVPRSVEYGPSQQIDLGPASDWDVVAADFDALATRLGC